MLTKKRLKYNPHCNCTESFVESELKFIIDILDIKIDIFEEEIFKYNLDMVDNLNVLAALDVSESGYYFELLSLRNKTWYKSEMLIREKSKLDK